MRYIENPYLYSRVQHSSDPTEEQRGLTFPNDLAMHLTNIQQKYTTGDIISRFLLRAQEDEKTYDYYKTFVEIIDS